VPRLMPLLSGLLITALCGCTANNPGPASPVGNGAAITPSASTSFVAWLDNEYTQSLDFSPLAKTRLGIKEDYGELDDVSEAALDKRLNCRGICGSICWRSPRRIAVTGVTVTSLVAMGLNQAWQITLSTTKK